MNPYYEVVCAYVDLMGIATWARRLLNEDGVQIEIQYGREDDSFELPPSGGAFKPCAPIIDRPEDLEPCQLGSGATIFGTFSDIVSQYDWKFPDQLVANGEPPILVAMVSACEIATLIVDELLRKLDATPADCIWRDRYRLSLREYFADFSRCFEHLSSEENSRRARNFLFRLFTLDMAFSKLLSLAILDARIYSPRQNGSDVASPETSNLNDESYVDCFQLLDQDLELLQAMLELDAIESPVVSATILERAGRPAGAKRVFTRVLANALVRSTRRGYVLTKLGKQKAVGHKRNVESRAPRLPR